MRVQMHVQEGAFVRVLIEACACLHEAAMHERKDLCTGMHSLTHSLTQTLRFLFLPLALLCNAANKYLAVEHA
jgi:hypothetical protein